jgi:DNA invertase Pin-like site-specific DNA recombinase
MQGIARREFDMVAAWSVDRLSRSLSHLVAFLGEIHGNGIDLYLHTQGLDTSTPTGKAMFQLLGAAAGRCGHHHHGAQGRRRHRHRAAHQAGNDRPFRRCGRLRRRAHK